MNPTTLLFIGITSLINLWTVEPKTNELKAWQVLENRTEYNGIYYSYSIKNTGTTPISSIDYQVFFKVEGKTVSFEKAPTEIQPGETIVYHSSKTFYPKNKSQISYSLEVKSTNSRLENHSLHGESMF
ncbi:hypothetical protein [Algoriphagus algorifonticola]|uniref:hypothetical protein n=1 Tax=Algoriphagus algorifonticola TaxID=2593007 RepID=UPI0011A69930|nr:hypothetical protein [Algoriphagus algorifonticola]